MPKGSNNPTESPPVGCSERWVRPDGLNIRFWTAGKGPALVLVHGLLGYSFSWRRVIPEFAGQFEVFAPDLPGAGFSDCDPTLDCCLSSAAMRLLGFLDAVGISSCDLVGSSYGGTTAMLTAALAPSRVRRLVLAAPANPWSRIGRLRLALLRNPAVARLFPHLARPMRRTQDYFLRRMWGDPRRITPDVYSGYAAPLARLGTLEHAIKIVKTWGQDMRDLKVVLPQLSNVPILLVWGSKDRAVDPSSAEPLGRNFKSVQVASIDGAGHLPYEEYPEAFCRIVTDFLMQTSRETTALHGK